MKRALIAALLVLLSSTSSYPTSDASRITTSAQYASHSEDTPIQAHAPHQGIRRRLPPLADGLPGTGARTTTTLEGVGVPLAGKTSLLRSSSHNIERQQPPLASAGAQLEQPQLGVAQVGGDGPEAELTLAKQQDSAKLSQMEAASKGGNGRQSYQENGKQGDQTRPYEGKRTPVNRLERGAAVSIVKLPDGRSGVMTADGSTYAIKGQTPLWKNLLKALGFTALAAGAGFTIGASVTAHEHHEDMENARYNTEGEYGVDDDGSDDTTKEGSDSTGDKK